jgi:hypothetical protein
LVDGMFVLPCGFLVLIFVLHSGWLGSDMPSLQIPGRPPLFQLNLLSPILRLRS